MLNKEQKNSPAILSVSQLNKNAKLSLEKKFNNVWVKGEISEFTNYKQSGHWYFTLKDENASINCVMFKFKNSYLKNIPEIGDEIILKGNISLFEAQGRFQFIAEALEYSGEGDLLKAYENLKKKLLLEGLFEESFKKVIPSKPMHIGVVSSPSGAVIQDIRNILERRAPLSKVTLSPSLVQGEKADDQIIKALEMLTTFNESYKIDLIIIARGGGSLEDLWCFNSEKLARKIYSLEIPIISAISHETDFTICDLVSDLRAPTPSSAAEIISQEHSNFFDRLTDLKRNGLFSLQKNFSNKKNFLKQNLNIFNKVDLNLDQKSLRLDENQNRFTYLQKENLNSKNLLLSKFILNLKDKNPFSKLSSQKADLSNMVLIYKNSFFTNFSEKRNIIKTLISKLNAFSPLAVLSRGYTVTTKNDELLESSILTKGDEIKTRTEKTIISSEIIDINEID